jgi:hypothetical protein
MEKTLPERERLNSQTQQIHAVVSWKNKGKGAAIAN